ncbi:MAG: DUF1294 domain-containing protein [Bacteroidaceae bacterium]|nr:DUF1294 domain-containing protein [Bacteroidaceae bacterium]
MNVHVIIIYYLLIVNAVAFIVYGIDKLKARKGRWRISEATLLLLALVGGSIGSWLGMKVWHHKTMHRKFQYGLPTILLLQLAIAVYLCTRM